jgi:hypothetical protein
MTIRALYQASKQDLMDTIIVYPFVDSIVSSDANCGLISTLIDPHTVFGGISGGGGSSGGLGGGFPGGRDGSSGGLGGGFPGSDGGSSGGLGRGLFIVFTFMVITFCWQLFFMDQKPIMF